MHRGSGTRIDAATDTGVNGWASTKMLDAYLSPRGGDEARGDGGVRLRGAVEVESELVASVPRIVMSREVAWCSRSVLTRAIARTAQRSGGSRTTRMGSLRHTCPGTSYSDSQLSEACWSAAARATNYVLHVVVAANWIRC